MLESFFRPATNCGLITSSVKSRVFSTRNPRLLPKFSIGDSVIPLCRQYTYNGAPLYISRTPRAQRTNPIVENLINRLDNRLKWLTNNATGISIHVAKTVFIAFIRSIIDYLSLVLFQIPLASFDHLELFWGDQCHK